MTVDPYQQIEVYFEDRLFKEVYFNINFNGYYLSAISEGSIRSTYPFLENNKELSMNVSFSFMDNNQVAKMFTIDGIRRILVKK